jgi:hypothetical protein
MRKTICQLTFTPGGIKHGKEKENCYNNNKVDIQVSARFWNNLHQVHSRSKNWMAK